MVALLEGCSCEVALLEECSCEVALLGGCSWEVALLACCSLRGFLEASSWLVLLKLRLADTREAGPALGDALALVEAILLPYTEQESLYSPSPALYRPQNCCHQFLSRSSHCVTIAHSLQDNIMEVFTR